MHASPTERPELIKERRKVSLEGPELHIHAYYTRKGRTFIYLAGIPECKKNTVVCMLCTVIVCIDFVGECIG